jgi:YVTN family beta-propeller protein
VDCFVGPNGIAISGNSVYVTDQYANSVTVHNLATGMIMQTVTGFSAPDAVAVTPDGRQIYVANGNSASVWALATSTLSVEAKIAVGLLPTAVGISADGTTAYVLSGYGYSITEINTATNTVTGTMQKVGVYPFSIALYQ